MKLNQLEKYKKSRQQLLDIHGEVLGQATNEDIREVAEEIGILEGNKIMIASELEKDAVMDYMLYREMEDGGSKISAYQESKTTKDEEADSLLQAMTESDTSLYEVIGVNKEEKTVMLRDAFDDSKIFTVVDFAMSETADEDLLVFTRLIHLDAFSMTSGLVLTFRKNHLEFLKKRSRKEMKKIYVRDEANKLFIAFFMLHRREGVPFGLEDME